MVTIYAGSAWPRQMRAETAAAYVDEKSVSAFRRACGEGHLYPSPVYIPGKGERWLKDQLDRALDLLHANSPEADPLEEYI